MSRTRLTERLRRQGSRKRAVEDSTPYPGTVNQPDRQFKQHKQYDNWEEVVGHPLQDLRPEWQNDDHDEIGFGIPESNPPTTASLRVAANKAVRLAVLLLGEKVSEEAIEEQARDFMAMDQETMDRTLARFAETQELYADSTVAQKETEEEADDKADDKAEGKEEKASDDKADDDKALALTAAEEAAKLAIEAAEAAAKVATEAAKVATKAAEAVEADKTSDSKVAEDDDDDDDDDDEGTEASAKAAAPKQSPTELDIELTSVSATDDIDPDTEVDAQLASLFEDDVPAELPEPSSRREASKKKGITKLPGQPKVAGASDPVANLSKLWKSAPDVSDVFN